MKEVRFIIYKDYVEGELKSELEEKFPDIKLEFKLESEDTVEITTDKPSEVYSVLNEKTLAYVAW